MQRTLNFLFNLGEERQNKQLSISFLIDLSGSMSGEPLERVKEALISMLHPLVLDTSTDSPAAEQVNLFSFHSSVQKVSPWVNRDNFDFFSECLLAIENIAFSGTGATALYDGINACLDSFSAQEVKKENEKIIIVFSDGGENASTHRKVEIRKKIKAFQNGYVIPELVEQVIKLDQHILDMLFKPFKKEDKYIIFKTDAQQNLEKVNGLEETFLKELKNSITVTKMPVKVCSLLYTYETTTKYLHPKALSDFATDSEGKIEVSPHIDMIPQYLESLISSLKTNDNNQFRSKLISRLESASNRVDYFRVININNSQNPGAFFIPEKNKIPITYTHPVYNYHIEIEPVKTRVELSKESFDIFHNDYLENISEDLFQNLDNQNLQADNFDQTPIVNIVLNGNDQFASVNTKNVITLVNRLRSTYIGLLEGVNPYLSYNIFILLSNYETYSKSEKIFLRCMLVELNSIFIENKTQHKFIFISDSNNSNHAVNHYTYKALTATDFEDHVLENLVNFNVLQGAITQIEEDFDNKLKLLTPGALSIKLDKSAYINKSVNIFVRKFIQNIITPEEYYPPKGDTDKIDKDSVNSILQITINNLKYNSLKQNLGITHALQDRFQCPNILSLTEFTKRKKLNYSRPDQDPHVQSSNSFEVNYANQYEYYQSFIFDLQKYVESGNSTDFFRAFILQKKTECLALKTEEIRNQTNKFLYQDKYASPLKANYWLKELENRIKGYINNSLSSDVDTEANKYDKDQVKFNYRKTEYTIDADPNRYLNQLRNKIKNLPLLNSLRFKYSFVSLVILTGILSILFAISATPGYFAFVLIPVLIYAYSIYQIYINQKQVELLSLSYYHSYRHKAIKKAYGILLTSVSEMYEEILSRISGEEELSFYSGKVSEKKYLDLFFSSLQKRISRYYDIQSNDILSGGKFSIQITPNSSFLNKNVVNADSFEFNKSWKETLHLTLTDEILQTEFSKIQFPYIILPIKPKLDKLTADAQWKFDIIEVIRDKKYILVLLHPLNKEEEEKLLQLDNSKFWNNQVTKLLNQNFNTEHLKGNLLSQWREIAEYENWLFQINYFVQNQQSNIDIDKTYLFESWKQKYTPRKEFIKLLFTAAEKLLTDNIDEINLWDILSKIDRNELKAYIQGITEPALQFRDQDRNIVRYYISNINNEDMKALHNFDLGLNLLNNYSVSHYKPEHNLNNEIRFISVSAVPINNSSILVDDLKSIANNNLIKEKESEEYIDLSFLEKHYNVSKLIDPLFE